MASSGLTLFNSLEVSRPNTTLLPEQQHVPAATLLQPSIQRQYSSSSGLFSTPLLPLSSINMFDPRPQLTAASHEITPSLNFTAYTEDTTLNRTHPHPVERRHPETNKVESIAKHSVSIVSLQVIQEPHALITNAQNDFVSYIWSARGYLLGKLDPELAAKQLLIQEEREFNRTTAPTHTQQQSQPQQTHAHHPQMAAAAVAAATSTSWKEQWLKDSWEFHVDIEKRERKDQLDTQKLFQEIEHLAFQTATNPSLVHTTTTPTKRVGPSSHSHLSSAKNSRSASRKASPTPPERHLLNKSSSLPHIAYNQSVTNHRNVQSSPTSTSLNRSTRLSSGLEMRSSSLPSPAYSPGTLSPK